jgi:heme A synthase
MKAIKELIEFLIEDTKTDIQCIKKIITGKAKIDLDKIKPKKGDIKEFLKEYWIWYLLIALAFFAGVMVSGAHFSAECNRFVAEEIVPMCDPFYESDENRQWQYIDSTGQASQLNHSFGYDAKKTPIFER